ncbi:hypothetical protein [Moheibacter sediminis]|uniref:Uncharacterized protein n=1 Tax=Moheibacter sediminis TaxID=1434700 RepID=A0A1W2C8A8_9FLAO|nr:hypothetical protein [Moheibacter sediminis]SMC81413.1 hypothetical protein SAMN06296427_10989 [Moheibacter sediminis]
MKKSIYLAVLFLFGIMLISCSGDDDSRSSAPPIPVDQRYLSKITDEQGELLVVINYNENKTIARMTIGGFIFRYEYNEIGKVQNMHLGIPGEGSASFSYTYDGNGKMNSYTGSDGVMRPVEYNAQENYYHFVEDEYDSYTIYLNSNQTLKKVIEHEQGENDIAINLFYEDGKYGPLHNTNDISLSTIVASPIYYYAFFSSFNLCSVPFQEVFGGQVYVLQENEFDQDNFLKNSIAISPFLSNEPIKLIYEYIQL